MVSADVVITEINSNALGGDFFELYNRGNTAVSLNGWSYDDDSVIPREGGVFGDITMQPGDVLVVVTGTGNSSAFAASWGLDPSKFVIFPPPGPGLGQNDLVAMFDDSNKLVTALSYASKEKGGIPPMALSSGVPAGGHAGISAGGGSGGAGWSAVWDGVSSIFAPRYTYAQLGVLGAFQGGDTLAIGSPGFVPEQVPEPSSLVLFGLGGIAGLIWCRRIRRTECFQPRISRMGRMWIRRSGTCLPAE
jgi:hypothetical protein